jgi:hypothetical protein
MLFRRGGSALADCEATLEPSEATIDLTEGASAAAGLPLSLGRSERKALQKPARDAALEIETLQRQLGRLGELAEVEREVAARRPARAGQPTFADLSMPIPDDRCNYLDRKDLDESVLDEDQLFYRRNGYLIKEGLIPDELTAPYLAERQAVTDEHLSIWGGSYMALQSMREVCLYAPLVDLIEKLIGEPVGLFLTLSGLETTRRTWHQDFYLKPGYENVDYCAAWIAVGDVHPDSGPYEYVPGSHRLPSMRQELIWEWLTPEERESAANYRIAETFVTDACARMVVEQELEPRFFLPKRGDVLIWHHSLLHQGSKANARSRMRPGLIAHYNSLAKQRELGRSMRQMTNGKWYRERSDQQHIVGRQLESAEFKAEAIAARTGG